MSGGHASNEKSVKADLHLHDVNKLTTGLRHDLGPGARFSKAPESFRARKAIFRSSVSKNGEVYTLETSCMKGTSLHLPSSLEYENKTALYSQGSRFCNGFTGPKSFRGFRETAPGRLYVGPFSALLRTIYTCSTFLTYKIKYAKV